MSRPPAEPYPPELDESAVPALHPPGDLTDVVAVGLDWAGRRAFGISARRVELRCCRLTGADLAEASLGDVVFDECRLDLAGLRHARLERVAFRDCRMDEIDLHGAVLTDVLFERCDLRSATLSSARLERVELRDCDLAGAHGAEVLRGARMPLGDVLANATTFAALAGIEIITSESPSPPEADPRDGTL